MDGLGSSLYASPSWAMASQAVLPSQPSQRVIVPAGATSETASSTYPSSTTRPGGSESNHDYTASVDSRRETNASNNLQDTAQEQRQQEQAVQQVLAQLRARDQEVRTHEQAHLSAAGPYATGGINYTYQTGPDGQKYAIGGSVGIDTSAIAGDPEATLQKARVVQRAALAPAQPSGQDMKVAAQASQMMMQAQVEIQMQRAEEVRAESEELDTETGLDSNRPSRSNMIETASIQISQESETDQLRLTNLSGAESGVSDRNEFELRLTMQVIRPDDLFATSA